MTGMDERKVTTTTYKGRTVTITRYHFGTAYARSGNAHNPTRYYRWGTAVDGKTCTLSAGTRREAIAVARDAIDGGEV